MKNVKVSMDAQLAERIDAAAANAGESVSTYLAEAGRQRVENESAAAVAEDRNRQLEALERLLAGPKWSVMENGRMPTADERNARR